MGTQLRRRVSGVSKETDSGIVIRIASLNIRSGRGGQGLDTATLVQKQLYVVRAYVPPQRPTRDTLDSTVRSVWDGGGGDAANWRPQRLTGTTEGPMGGGPCEHHCEPWAVRPVTAIHSNMEVPNGGKLYVEDVQRR